MFPDVKDEYDKILNKHHENNLFKDKFNGKIIMELTGLENKELGMFMTWAKEQIEKSNMRFMFVKYGQHTCDLIIKSLYTHYVNNWEWLAVTWQDSVDYVRS
jgi:hypothetical protein